MKKAVPPSAAAAAAAAAKPSAAAAGAAAAAGGAAAAPHGSMFDPWSFAPSGSSLRRIRTDLAQIFKDPPPGIFVCVDEKNVAYVDALVTGPADTPYEGGFFWFKMHFPSDYPNRPPKVTLQTTGGGRVRFNPNLYKDGKVCLSILGTWEGPGWSPAHSCASVLVSIQSLMNARPYTNEPGFETPKNPRDVESYNECIVHETVRVAFCETLENTAYARSLPEQLRALVREVAPGYLDFFKQKCRERLPRDKTVMNDPFGEDRGRFQWSGLLERLERLSEVLPKPAADEDEDEEEEGEEASGERAGGAASAGSEGARRAGGASGGAGGASGSSGAGGGARAGNDGDGDDDDEEDGMGDAADDAPPGGGERSASAANSV